MKNIVKILTTLCNTQGEILTTLCKGRQKILTTLCKDTDYFVQSPFSQVIYRQRFIEKHPLLLYLLYNEVTI